MIKFIHKTNREEAQYGEHNIEIVKHDAERIDEYFNAFFQFLRACTFFPETIEKEMREIIKYLDENEDMNIDDIMWS